MYIDCHVHLRDDGWKHKETIEHGLNVAEDSLLDAVFDMPNTEPPVTTRSRVLERFELARSANSPVFYGAYIGLTEDKEQIKEAVETWREFFPRYNKRAAVVGLKMFAGRSVGSLSVISPFSQLEVYSQLSKMNYQGVLVVHCEKESEMHPELFDPSKPITHCYARPEKSEVESVKDPIKFAISTGYSGHLHIPHVSVPESVELIRDAEGKLRISCGATPHHLLLDNRVMEEGDGILYKVNPPLRNPDSVKKLFDYLIKGYIDVLESDHAPHTLEEKTKGDKIKGYLSGIPNLASWPDFVNLLIARGVTQEMIDRMAFENVNKIFGLQIQRTKRDIKSHIGEYVFDPYENLK